MPLYHVSDGDESRLVEAKSAAQAIRHVVADRFTATVPTPLQAAHLAARGLPIEMAGDHADEEAETVPA